MLWRYRSFFYANLLQVLFPRKNMGQLRRVKDDFFSLPNCRPFLQSQRKKLWPQRARLQLWKCVSKYRKSTFRSDRICRCNSGLVTATACDILSTVSSYPWCCGGLRTGSTGRLCRRTRQEFVYLYDTRFPLHWVPVATDRIVRLSLIVDRCLYGEKRSIWNKVPAGWSSGQFCRDFFWRVRMSTGYWRW